MYFLLLLNDYDKLFEPSVQQRCKEKIRLVVLLRIQFMGSCIKDLKRYAVLKIQ